MAMSEACVVKSGWEAQPAPEREFEKCLLDSIDEGLTEIIGEWFKGTFYKLIEQKFQVTRSSLPNRLDILTSALSAALGNGAGAVMGRAIAKRFYSRLGLRFVQNPNHSLQDYVTDAKAIMLSK